MHAHKASTSVIASLGTSVYVENLHLEAGEILKQCRCLSKEIHRKHAQHDTVVKVHKANKHRKDPSIQPTVVACWGSYQKETTIFNSTCHNLHKPLHNILDESACDNDLMKGKTWSQMKSGMNILLSWTIGFYWISFSQGYNFESLLCAL